MLVVCVCGLFWFVLFAACAVRYLLSGCLRYSDVYAHIQVPPNVAAGYGCVCWALTMASGKRKGKEVGNLMKVSMLYAVGTGQLATEGCLLSLRL